MIFVYFLIGLVSGIMSFKNLSKEFKKLKEYKKTMNAKEANAKVVKERTKKEKIILFLFLFSAFATVLLSTGDGNENEIKKEISNKETEENKKTEKKAEVTKENTGNAQDYSQQDPYVRIENQVKSNFSRIRKITATEMGVIVEAEAQDGINEKMIVKGVLKDSKEYVKSINKAYKEKNLTYESITLSFFYPMSDGNKTEDMKIIQINYENENWDPSYVLPAFQKSLYEIVK